MVVCHCGRLATMKTSWTNNNPGRRFYTCPVSKSKCNFFIWIDPPMCARSSVIIPGLLRSREQFEQRVKEQSGQLHRKNMWLIGRWLFFVAFWVLVFFLM
ncbi:hypothetical protein R6Q59_022048 [Mikania micrantha]